MDQVAVDQWRSLFLSQKSIADIVQIQQTSEILKEYVNQALEDHTSAGKRGARGQVFLELGYDCLLSCHSFNLKRVYKAKRTTYR